MKRAIGLRLISLLLAIAAADVSAAEWYVNLNRVDAAYGAVVNTGFSMGFTLSNNGAEPIADVDIRYVPTGGTPCQRHYVFDQPVPAGEDATFAVDGFVCDVSGREVFGVFELVAVNGERNNGDYTYVYLFCADALVSRRVVVEEATNVNCGYCPRGLAAMEHMRETVTDGSWIGISVQKEGAMSVNGLYADFWSYVSGTPRCFVNRDFENGVSPMPAVMDDVYSRYSTQYAVVDVDASVRCDVAAKTAMVDVQTRFVLEEQDVDYRLAYIITEDNVGPYNQRNYYSGGANGEMFGWENKAYYEPTVYNDVARNGSVYGGIAGAVPSTVTPDRSYTYSHELDMSEVDDIEQAYVTVMVINGRNGRIENAVRVPVAENTSRIDVLPVDSSDPIRIVGGIGEIVLDRDCDVAEMYALDGRLVCLRRDVRRVAVEPGAYIVKAGGAVAKVLVR